MDLLYIYYNILCMNHHCIHKLSPLPSPPPTLTPMTKQLMGSVCKTICSVIYNNGHD